MFSQWRQTLHSRFADREDLGKTRVRQLYWPEFPEKAIVELFELIEGEYQLPAGFLRPDDPINKLLKPVQASNPIKWLFYQSRAEDRHSELNYRLSKRQRQHGTQKVWEHTKILTVNDLVRAWCGELPLTT